MIRNMIPRFMEEATGKDGDLDMDKFTDRFAEAIQSYYLSLLPKKKDVHSLSYMDKGYNQAISEMEAKIKGENNE